MSEFGTGSYDKFLEILKNQRAILTQDLFDPELKNMGEYTHGKLDMLDVLEVLINKKGLVEA